MDDLIKSFKAQMYDRVTSPLLSSFLISWAAWNHRLFLVIFSSDFKIKEKFQYIDNVLYPGLYEVGLRGFLWPLLSALALLLLYPIPGRWIYEYVHNEQKKLKEIQQRIDDETPLSKADAQKLRAEVRKTVTEHVKEIAERDAEIEKLKKSLSELESESLERRIGDLEHEAKGISDEAAELLMYFPAGRDIAENQLSMVFPVVTDSKRNEFLRELVTAGLIQPTLVEAKGRRFLRTEAGSRYVEWLHARKWSNHPDIHEVQEA